MTTSNEAVADVPGRMPLVERLATNPDGVLEEIATTFGVSTLDVVHALPEAHRTIVSGTHFETIMGELTSWGPILLIVHTSDLVLECEGPMPPGSMGRGYFNIHGESPIGGHIRASRVHEIAFVSRPFMGRESRSIQVFNRDGNAMFKVFVRRDAARNLIAEQVALFDGMRAKYASLA